MMIHFSLGLNAGMIPARGETAGPAWTATLAEFSRDMSVFDSGIHLGNNAVAVPLSVTTDAPDGTEIRVRFVHADTGAEVYPWRVIGTASGGALSATYFQPANARTPFWVRAEVHVAGSSAAPAAMAHRCAAGHIWAFWEQSNYARLNKTDFALTAYDDVTPGRENDVQIIRTNDGGDRSAPIVAHVNDANRTVSVSPAQVAMANLFTAARPGEKLALVWQTQSGTSFADALTDPAEDETTWLNPDSGEVERVYEANPGTPPRNWSDDRRIHDMACADGQQVGCVFVPGWIENIWSGSDNGKGIPRYHFMRYLGLDPDTRADIAIGTAAEIAALPEPKLAMPRLGTARKGGIYDFHDGSSGYTRLGFFGPHEYPKRLNGAGDPPSIPLAADVTDISQLVHDSASDPNYNTLVANARAMFDQSTHPEVLDFPGVNHGSFRFKEWIDIDTKPGDDLHFDPGPDGRTRHGVHAMALMLTATGAWAYPAPTLDRRYDDPAGAWTDLWIDGHDLSTERLRRAAAGTLGDDHNGNPVPAVIPPLSAHGSSLAADEDHRTEVMGCHIDTIAVTRAEIHAIDASDISGGHTAPPGRRVLRIHARAGETITGVSQVGYGFGAHPCHLVVEDYVDRAYLNKLVVDMGQPGLPALLVQDQMTAMLPTTHAAADLFSTSDVWVRNSNAGPLRGDTRVVIHANMRVNDYGNGNRVILSVGNDLYIRTESSGIILFTDGPNAVQFPATAGQFYDFKFIMDRTDPAAGLKIVVDDGPPITAPCAGGAFPTSGRMSIFQANSASQTAALTGEFIRLYRAKVAVSGAPDYAVEGAPGAVTHTFIHPPGDALSILSGTIEEGSVA